MKAADREKQIAEEVFLIEHSGEIPEVAFYSSLYFLTEDNDGPGFSLLANEILLLKNAVVRRYRTIIARDLEPGNRDKRSYRGLARCSVNWQRLFRFCVRENIAVETIRTDTAKALKSFLQREAADVLSCKRASSLNCPAQEIENLADALGLGPADLPAGWQELCPEQG